MQISPRKFLLALVLAIVVNIAVASVHAATHMSLDLVECEMCAAFFDTSDAIVDDRQGNAPSLGQSIAGSDSGAQATDNAVVSAFPRGPPASI